MTNLVWVRDASLGVGCERLGGDDRTPFRDFGRRDVSACSERACGRYALSCVCLRVLCYDD